MVPDAQQPDEPKDQEFGSYCFEKLEPAKVLNEISTEVIVTQGGISKSVECSIDLQKSFKVESITLNFEEKLLKIEYLQQQQRI